MGSKISTTLSADKMIYHTFNREIQEEPTLKAYKEIMKMKELAEKCKNNKGYSVTGYPSKYADASWFYDIYRSSYKSAHLFNCKDLIKLASVVEDMGREDRYWEKIHIRTFRVLPSLTEYDQIDIFYAYYCRGNVDYLETYYPVLNDHLKKYPFFMISLLLKKVSNERRISLMLNHIFTRSHLFVRKKSHLISFLLTELSRLYPNIVKELKIRRIYILEILY